MESIYLFDIERAVLDIDKVRQCKVVVSEINGVKTHVAHIALVKDSDKHATLRAIKEHCVAKLATNHMLTLVKLYDSTLPVAASGKLDIVKIENDTSDIVENLLIL